jgi:hypothetical protein
VFLLLLFYFFSFFCVPRMPALGGRVSKNCVERALHSFRTSPKT